MVKIKTIKKMNLPELIQWCWDNDITFKTFFGSQKSAVYFDRLGQVSIHGSVTIDETFEFEVEEKITEQAMIANLVQVYKEDNNTFVSAWTSDTIEEINALTKRNGCSSIAFYMLNEDMTLSLIWKDGEMVE